MPGIGEPAGEDPLVERGCDGFLDDHATERDVTGVDALREGDQIGRHAPVIDREPLTAAGEAGHHLVGDHHNAELVADRTHALEVAGRWHQNAVRPDDRLEDDRGHRLRALDHDQVAQVSQRAFRLFFRRSCVERRAVGVRAPVVDDAGHRRFGAPSAGVTGHRDRAGSRTVIAAVGREHLVPAGVQLGHPHRVLGCLGTAVGEEDAVQVAGREFGDHASGFAARVVGERRRDRRHPSRVLLNGGDQLRMLVADVDVHQPGREVQVPVAVVVGEVRALGRRDRQRVDQRLRRP